MKKILVLLTIAAFGACIQKKIATENNVEVERLLTISFISKGNGVDHNAVTALQDLIKQDSSAQCEVKADIAFWGREGERDYCFVFKNTSCYTQFVNDVKDKFKNNSKVIVQENKPCRNK